MCKMCSCEAALHPESATGEWPWSTLIQAFLERRPWLQSHAHGFWAHISQELWKGHGLKFQSGFKKASYENWNCQKLRALKLSTEKSAQMKQTQICLYLPGSSDRMLQSWTSELKRSECPTKNQTLTAQYLWLEPSRRWRANLHVNPWVVSGVALADPILCTKSCFSTTCIVLQVNQMSRKCQQSTGSPWPPSRFHMVPLVLCASIQIDTWCMLLVSVAAAHPFSIMDRAGVKSKAFPHCTSTNPPPCWKRSRHPCDNSCNEKGAIYYFSTKYGKILWVDSHPYT